jgi:hypothetical protein
MTSVAFRESVLPAQDSGRRRKHEYCYACYTGDYPTELVDIEELIAARQKGK